MTQKPASPSLPHVVHFEFTVPDPEQAGRFYAQVFGWSIQKLPDPVRYWQIKAAGNAKEGITGGIVQSKSGAPRVSVTIQVESLDETCAKVLQEGGALVTERQAIPGFGLHILCKDPQGNFFALIQSM
ncbi:VOC family protein [Geothrix sp. PMB-07]|uniref:VOC family protein n=1 Tax=Geothrix sp. PMB-07 TaxID=3068640 RepID=UPI002742980C|nr:VOC family protein [Geothrix sp. PMB-07]WLT31006.1 VOC family protein [Geothrix sp. PMB-07]